jgi:hypothetical protein
MEVREEIYGYLLVYNEPILVKHDLVTVERNPFQDHSIVLVCKQIAQEASAFIYRTNAFRAIFRRPNYVSRQYDKPSTIEKKFHQYFRNVIIDCTSDCWNLDWQGKATCSIGKLVEAKPYIATLTLVVVPQQVSMSTTALGMEASPITFADFMWYPGDFMTAIRKLAPRLLKIIIKKIGLLTRHVEKRLEISIDLNYLQEGSQEKSLMANPETIQMAGLKEQAVHEELMGLKQRFEEIFENDEHAVHEGKCTLIYPNEKAKPSEKLSDVIGFTAAESSSAGGNGNVENESGTDDLWVFSSVNRDQGLAPIQ